jgi:hypothetical protein
MSSFSVISAAGAIHELPSNLSSQSSYWSLIQNSAHSLLLPLPTASFFGLAAILAGAALSLGSTLSCNTAMSNCRLCDTDKLVLCKATRFKEDGVGVGNLAFKVGPAP